MMHRLECDPLVRHRTAAEHSLFGCGCWCHGWRAIRLPGVCRACGLPVTFNGKRWIKPGSRGVAHACRVTCGYWMPYARERCERRPGHGGDHRTGYALANDARRSKGYRLAASL